MTVLEKKICMMGAPGVGKTSLVRRFVDSVFSDKYHSTIGVKVDRKVVELPDVTLNLMLWDLQGEEAYQSIRMQYLRGASGYILVADGTRADTFEVAIGLQENAAGRSEDLPFVLCLNKADLWGQWTISAIQQEWVKEQGWPVVQTSARTGDGVEDAFMQLAERMLERHNRSA